MAAPCASVPIPARSSPGSKAAEAYGTLEISERHRHRYEFNEEYKDRFQAAGMLFSGSSPDGRLVEVIEIPSHPFFVASQFHPEFRASRSTRTPFRGLRPRGGQARLRTPEAPLAADTE